MFAPARATTLQSRLDALHTACVECASIAQACARACAESGFPDRYRRYSRVCADCRDICVAAAGVAKRFDGGESDALLPMLRACARISTLAAVLCTAHMTDFSLAGDLDSACAKLRAACAQLSAALRWRLSI
jgi:hypothetical protein